MTTIYKLLTNSMTSHRETFGSRSGTFWVLGEPRSVGGTGDFGSDGWLYACTHPLLAVLLNPIHADTKNPRLFRGEGSGAFHDDRGLNVAYATMVLLEEISLPVVTMTQRVAFGILCAKQVCTGPAWNAWNAWADAWLSGADRSERSTWAAKGAVETARNAPPGAAWRAMNAVANAAEEATAAAAAAARAMDVAAEAAFRASDGAPLDLIGLAELAMEIT